MGVNCKINKNKDGTIDYVEGNDGKRSKLYDDLRLIFDDQKALDYLAVTESENFKKDNPTVREVIEFANSTEEPLSKKETEEALDTAVALGVSNSYELDTVLRQAFLENGMVVFDRQKLKKAGFNDYEISKIMSEQNQTKISNLVYKLRNTEFVVESDDSNIQYGSETTLFGKQKPITEAVEKGVFEIANGEISEKKSDTKQTLRKTYPLQPKPYNTKPFLAIQTLKDNVAQRNENDVKKVLEKVKNVAFDYGVDLRGIENKIHPIENLKKFITSLERYFNNPDDSFADDYDSFFDISLPSPKVKVNEVELDTELSEYELFRDFNLVRKEGNVYTKVKPESLENIRTYFFQQQSELKSPEEVQSKLAELELEDFEIDGDTVEKMYMWKKFLNYPIKTVSNMKPDFIDISELRENPYKKVTSNGVKLKNNDSLTKAKSELYESPTEKGELDLDDNNRRKELLNNKFAIEKIKTDYSFIEDGVLMTKNNSNDFVRTPLGVFEKVFEYGNLSFYTETTSENLELTDADFSKYFSQAQEVENIIEAKNYYAKKEIEEINNKYFECK